MTLPIISSMSHSFPIKRMIKAYASGGNVLIVTTILALIIANIPAINQYYFELWEQKVTLEFAGVNLFGHEMTMMQFINDALMSLFFFSIGLEIKREVLVGELSSFRQALLPIIAACGGMIVPILIFGFMAQGTDYARGSAIPMATDIAFSLGVLSMLGKRVPLSLKIFLTTLAVVDDIGGIIVIALFYSTSIHYMLLVYSLGALLFLYMGSVFRINSKLYYAFFGFIVWYLFLNSGIHPTISGVLVAFCIPAKPVLNPKKFIVTIRETIGSFPASEDETLTKKTIFTNDQLSWLKRIESASDKVISPLQDIEDSLTPVVNYIVLPLFAFSNAGIYFGNVELSAIYGGVGLAIICGLFFGKFIGIFSFSWLAIKLRLAPMPYHSNWKMLGSVAMLGGIGFTVSLFIANLSFVPLGALGVELLNDSKLSILLGSVLSGLVGYILLHLTLPKTPVETDDDD